MKKLLTIFTCLLLLLAARADTRTQGKIRMTGKIELTRAVPEAAPEGQQGNYLLMETGAFIGLEDGSVLASE